MADPSEPGAAPPAARPPEPSVLAPPAVEPQPARPDLRRELPAILAMAVLFAASIGLAVAFSSTFNEMGVKAFSDPNNAGNVLVYLVVVVVFTLGILLLAKLWKPGIKILILGSILATVYYVFWPPLVKLLGPSHGAIGAPELISGALSVALAALLWFYPEWYVIDLVGVAVAAGAAGIFGISLSILPTLLLLVAFAVYDAIAVYRTKHMLALADSVLELRLPIMFVVPKSRGYSFLEETRRLKTDEPQKQKREAMFMGLGDAVIPGILVVSATTFLAGSGAMWVAGATLIGSLAGFGVLMWFVAKGNAHAGLPLLNGGAIVGFLAALLPLYGLKPLWPF
jgi:presenilin-like A22 family membrane protease